MRLWGAVADEVAEHTGGVGGSLFWGILNDLFEGEDAADAYVDLGEPSCSRALVKRSVIWPRRVRRYVRAV